MEAGGRGRRVWRRHLAGAGAAAPRSILSARAPLDLPALSAAGVACSTRASVPAGEKGGGAGDDGAAGGGRRAGAVLNPCLSACGGEGRRGRGRWSSGRRETRRRRGRDGSSAEWVREQSRPSGFVT